ncbi:MAG TPA: hypothetical protein VF803_00845 [Candidatus Paceibacterota bacterium]
MDSTSEQEGALHSNASTLHWTTPTHLGVERSVDWFWALGVIALFGAIIALWLGDTLFAAIIVLAAITIGMIATRPPREHDVMLYEGGFVLDHAVYPFSSLESFWIEEGGDLPKLYLSTSALLHPHITLYLPSSDYIDEVRDFLEMYEVKEEVRHSAGTILAHMFGW